MIDDYPETSLETILTKLNPFIAVVVINSLPGTKKPKIIPGVGLLEYSSDDGRVSLIPGLGKIEYDSQGRVSLIPTVGEIEYW